MSLWSVWDTWGLAPTAQGYEALAKDDTLFYGRGATFALLATDLSQFATNLTAAATNISQASPSRFNVAAPWTIEVDCDTNNTDTGRPFTFGTTAANNFLSLSVSAGSLLAIMTVAPGSTITVSTLALPSIGAVDAHFVLGWAAEPNKATTGASDAVRYTLFAYNVTAGTYAQNVFSQVARTLAAGALVFGAQNAAGTNPFLGQIRACRASAGRVRTPTETHEDFVARTAAPTLALQDQVEYPIVDPACDIAEPGHFAGPVYFWGAGSVQSMTQRLFSPIVDVVYLNRIEIHADDYTTVIPTRYLTAAPDAAYSLFANYALYRELPPTADRLHCYVFVKQWRTAGATHDRMHYRVYSMNRPPLAADVVDQAHAMVAHYASGSLVADHGSGGTDGEWIDLGLLEPVRNTEGHTWLVLAVRTEDLSGATANQRFEIGALVVEPGVVA